MADGSRKAIIWAFIANLSIAIAKFVGFLITRSAGMLAESVHSLADTGNQGLLLLGFSRSKKRADADHPFGYARERYFWAFSVALVLFSMGGLFALYEGINKFLHADGHQIESVWVAVAILVFGLLIEGYSLRTAIIETKKVKGDKGWWSYIRTAKQPELPVVLLEDSAAELGLSFALIGVLLAHYTGDARWDALGSIMIGILLIVVAIILIIEMRSLLIGEAASAEDRAKIRTAIEGSPQVDGIIHMRTEHLGPEEILLAAKVEYDSALTFDELSDRINETEANIRSAVPATKMIFIEPDFHRDNVAPSD